MIAPTASHAFIDQSREQVRSDKELTPLRVEGPSRFGGDGLVERALLLLLKFHDVLTYRDDRAISDYDEAIRLAPRFALAYNNRGEAYVAKNDPDHR